ncbi:Protein real-time [Trichinella pseudospiralis]
MAPTTVHRWEWHLDNVTRDRHELAICQSSLFRTKKAGFENFPNFQHRRSSNLLIRETIARRVELFAKGRQMVLKTNLDRSCETIVATVTHELRSGVHNKI